MIHIENVAVARSFGVKSRPKTRVTKMFRFFAAFVIFTAFHIVSATYKADTIVTPRLQARFNNGDNPHIFVTLKEDTSRVLHAIESTQFPDRSARLNALYNGLTRHASKTQALITTYLKDNNVSFTSFWVTNQIYIKQGHLRLTLDLETNFKNLISSLDEEQVTTIAPPVVIDRTVGRSETAGVEWGVEKIQAPQAWEYLGKDLAAKDVIVGVIDSGVRGTHEALRGNFVGEYGWFDPIAGTPTPTDDGGHGTHVTGTILGGLGIGVAPNAKWMACRAALGAELTAEGIVYCAQFVICPFLPDGTNPNCSKAPHIVSNSWGGPAGNEVYEKIVNVWSAAKIIPVFAIGNDGRNGCNTAGYPGSYNNVIAVGSTTPNDSISEFSSRGPTQNGLMKPDVSAPGSAINSASHQSDNGYVILQGTSMACPHVSGLVALLLTNDHEMPYEEVKSLLINNTDKQLTFDGTNCGGVADNVFPNNVFGHGRVNAVKSVKAFMPNPTYRRSAGNKINSFNIPVIFTILICIRCFTL